MTKGGHQMLHVRPGRVTAVFLGAFCLLALASADLVLNFNPGDLRFASQAVLASPGDRYEISAPFKIGPDAGIELQQGTITLARSPAGRAAGVPVSVPQDGSARLTIEDAVFQLAGTQGPEDSQSPPPSAPLVEALATLNFDVVSIRRGTVKVFLPSGHAETLTDVNAEVSAKRKSSLAIRGNGTLRGQSVSFEVSAPSLNDRKPGARLPLIARVKSSLLEIAFDGRLAATDVLQLQGQAEIAIANLRQVARWFGAPWPTGSALRGIAARGEINWQAPTLTFDRATFRMDGNEATGTLALALDGARPMLTGTLALKTLDLTPYVPLQPGFRLSGALSSLGGDTSELSLPTGRQLDADVRISAGRILLHGLEGGRFAASVSLKQGRLLADVAEIGLDQGTGSGQLTADLTGHRPLVAVRCRLEDVDAARASTLILGHGAVQGLSTITVDLSATGDTRADLVRTLRGKVGISLREGGRLGIDLKSLMGAAQKSDLDGWSLAMRGQTPIDGLEAKLRVDSGVVASEHVEATFGDLLLRAIGTVSLASRQLDLRLLLAAAPAAAARAQAAAPRDVLVFRGPWSAPNIQIER
jgi:AsmA protein